MKDFIQLISPTKDIRPLAALLSVLTFVTAVNTPNPLNNDGALYLQTAEVFARSGWQAAMQVYGWPFYSVLIAWSAKLTSLSFEHAAYVLNAVLLVVIVTTFITLIKEIGASRTVQFFGAIVILSHPRLNHYQNYIIRGFGYWAFSLLSVLYLLRYYRRPLWRYALGWGTCISVATLFRIEGATLCCFIPLVLLFRSNTGLWSRLGHALKAYTVNIIILSGLLTWWFCAPDLSSAQLGRLSEFWSQFQSGLMLSNTNLQNKAALISQTVSDDASKTWGLIMTFTSLAGMYLYRLVKTLWPLHVLLCAYGIYKKLMPTEDGAKKVLTYFALLNLLIPAIHIGQTSFISHRFVMLASLLLLLWSPFSLNSIFQHWRDKKRVLTAKSLLFPSLSLVLLIMFVCAFIPPKQPKAYVVSAGTWLKHNMPEQAKLYSNKRAITFYAQRQFVSWDISEKPPIRGWTPDDFIALRVKRNRYEKISKRLTELELKAIKVFANKRGDRVIILKGSKGQKQPKSD
ncbi:MAG: hypothetical protein JRF64_01445 [Deltaproteobacteria bacterium]|nr:hypothetical protein [Deltaproteobacteria bacterium]